MIDVPGNHFDCLRQSPANMAPLVTALKAALSRFGWVPGAASAAANIQSEELQVALILKLARF